MFKWLPDTRVEWRDADQCREEAELATAAAFCDPQRFVVCGWNPARTGTS